MYMSYSKNPYLPKVRQQAVQLVYQGWSARKVGRHLGVASGTVSKWLKKDNWYGRIPIPTLSSRPSFHPHQLKQELVEKIIEIRESHHRCAEVVYQQMLNQGYSLSLSSVKRTLERNGLIAKRSPWKRYHPPSLRPAALLPGSLVQIDTIHLGPCDRNRIYVYTLLDVFSRWAFALVSKMINTRVSLEFVREARTRSPFVFETLQSDHGPEFSSHFTERIRTQGLIHRHSRVRRPNDNGHLERFNRTLQEECLSRLPRSLRAYQKEIPQYLEYYNGQRLHLGLNLKTPLECVQAID